jgi:hypothetical protein
MRRTYKKRGGDLNNTPLNKRPLNIPSITIKRPSITIKRPNGTELTLPKKRPNSKINLTIKLSVNDEIEYSKQMIRNHLRSYNNSMNKMKQAEKILSNGSPENNVSNINYVRNIINTAKGSIIAATGLKGKNGYIQIHKRKLKSMLDKHKTKLNNAHIKEIEELLERVKNF